MTQQVDFREQKAGSAPPRIVTIEWANETNEEGGPTRWFGSWLVTGDAVEGAWFYSGHGSERTEHSIPVGVTGIRVRKWVSEGLDPEYLDVALDGDMPIRTTLLDFDTPQLHRVFRSSGG